MITNQTYLELDKKNRELIKKNCPEQVLDSIVWYNTATAGDEVQNACRFLKFRGLLKHHPMIYPLVRFA